MESLDVAVTFRSYRPVRPAIREKRKFLGGVPRRFIELCDEESAAERRLQRGDQQSVVATRLVPRDRAERVAADAVGHQPLARFRGAQVAANVAAEIDHGGKRRRGMIGWRLHRGIMEPCLGFWARKKLVLLPGRFERVNLRRSLAD